MRDFQSKHIKAVLYVIQLSRVAGVTSVCYLITSYKPQQVQVQVSTAGLLVYKKSDTLYVLTYAACFTFI